MKLKGFTLVELVVSIAIVTILSGIILFSVTQYINKGKDSNLYGNLAILIPAGEVYYTGKPNSYQSFCDSSVKVNAFSQMPTGGNRFCYVNPTDNYQSWAACAVRFSDSSLAYCVDSRGMKKDNMLATSCTADLAVCP